MFRVGMYPSGTSSVAATLPGSCTYRVLADGVVRVLSGLRCQFGVPHGIALGSHSLVTTSQSNNGPAFNGGGPPGPLDLAVT